MEITDQRSEFLSFDVVRSIASYTVSPDRQALRSKYSWRIEAS